MLVTLMKKMIINESKLTSVTMEDKFWEWIMDNNHINQAWDWYCGYDVSALRDLVYDYMCYKFKSFDADTFHNYYIAAQTAVNKFGFYNWSEEK